METEWDGSVKTRIHIPPFEWRKRRPNAPVGPDRSSRHERVLRRVVEEKGVPREAAIEALEAFVCDEVGKHFGEERHLGARYNPEEDRVEVFQAIMVVEQLDDDAAEAVNQRTPAQLSELSDDPIEPGDELVFQIFYRKDEGHLAQAQDEQFGGILGLKTYGRGMKPWPVWVLREGVLAHLPP